MKEVARHEKHLLVSFTNLLYQQLDDFKEDPEGDMNKKIQEALDDAERDAEGLRTVLKEA